MRCVYVPTSQRELPREAAVARAGGQCVVCGMVGGNDTDIEVEYVYAGVGARLGEGEGRGVCCSGATEGGVVYGGRGGVCADVGACGGRVCGVVEDEGEYVKQQWIAGG